MMLGLALGGGNADGRGVKDRGKQRIQLEAGDNAPNSIGVTPFLPVLTPDTAQKCR